MRGYLDNSEITMTIDIESSFLRKGNGKQCQSNNQSECAHDWRQNKRNSNKKVKEISIQKMQILK